MAGVALYPLLEPVDGSLCDLWPTAAGPLMRSTALFTAAVLLAVLLWPKAGYVWLAVVLAIVAVTVFAGWRMGTW